MAGINNVGQSGLSYIDQLKSLQENKKAEGSTGKQDLKQEDFLSLLTKQLSQQDPFKPVSNDQMIAQNGVICDRRWHWQDEHSV